MTRMLNHSMQRWLALERAAASEGDAERALAAVFAVLPLAEPSVDFVARVVSQARGRVDLFARRWMKALVAAGVAALTLSLVLLPVTLTLLGRWLGPSRLVEATTRGLLLLSDGMVGAVSVWHGMGELGSTVSMLAASPQGVWALALTASLTGLAVVLLRGFLIDAAREVAP